MSQKRKKHRKSWVFVPDDAGIEFAIAQPQLDINRKRGMQRTEIVDAGPHRSEHYKYTGTSDASLNTIPYAMLLSSRVIVKAGMRTMPWQHD
jgi:hypothetical protein